MLNLVDRKSAQWILEGDIRGCFDNISHDWMIDHIPMDKKILRKWLKAGSQKATLYPTEAGTPQGGIISPALANMTLDGLEAELAKVPQPRQGASWLGMQMTSSLPETRRSCWKMKSNLWLRSFSQRAGTLSGEDQHYAYRQRIRLPRWNIRKYNGKLLIKPSKKNVHDHPSTKSEALVKANKTPRSRC